MLQIIGVGLDPQKHCSSQLIGIMREADINITFDPIGNIRSFLADVGARTENIERLYPDHLHRQLYYSRISEYVVDSATRHQRVTYLTYGNPCILNEPVANIVRMCRDSGLAFKIWANVSFLDEILAENGLCVGYSGIRMCTARALIENAATSPSEELLVVSQPIELGSLDENQRLKVLPSDLVRLVERLLEMRGNSPTIVTQAATTHAPSNSLKATIATLPFFAAAINTLTSIIVLPR
jgi:hypothetical protein